MTSREQVCVGRVVTVIPPTVRRCYALWCLAFLCLAATHVKNKTDESTILSQLADIINFIVLNT